MKNRIEINIVNKIEHHTLLDLRVQCNYCEDKWKKTGSLDLVIYYRNDDIVETAINNKLQTGLIQECISHHIDHGNHHNQFTFFSKETKIGFGNISTIAYVGEIDSNFVASQIK